MDHPDSTSTGNDRAAVERTERWFLSRGIPHFIHDYSARRDVFTRAIPALMVLLVLQLTPSLDPDWPVWWNVVVSVTSLAALVGIWAALNRTRHRPLLARPESIGAPELAVFLLVPSLSALAAGGQWLAAVSTLLSQLVLLGLVYVVLSYGVVPMTTWAARRLVLQCGDLLGLLVRALPLLLLYVTVFFLNAEIWQAAATMGTPFLAVILGLFVLIGMVFLLGRIPREVRPLGRIESWDDVVHRVNDTPAVDLCGEGIRPKEPPPLSRRQWGNVGLVVLFSEGLQILFVSVMIGAFFVGFGILAITPATASAWAGGSIDVLVEWELWGRPVVVTAELLRVAGLLVAFTGLYFTVTMLIDTTYREEFLAHVLDEVRQALAVRAVYLAAIDTTRE